MQLPKPGDTLLGKYVLESSLGVGGMGVVYAARHDMLGQRVAVKLIKPEFAVRAKAVQQFLNEARSAARIQNEHVARVLDVGMLESGLPYMVLEYLDGSDLGKVLYERGRLPVTEAIDYVMQAIEAVAHAHTLGIVHRDLKPSNLFLARRQGGGMQVKVFDFGISKIMGDASDGPANMTKTNAILGSPLYMSPEQLRDSKAVDHRSDIWSFGVLTYELLTGRPPFVADNAVALFAAISESEPASILTARPDVSPELDAAILKCLQRKRDDRFGSVTELAFALAPFGSTIAARSYENTSRIMPLGERGAVSNLASTTNPEVKAADTGSSTFKQEQRSVTAAMPPADLGRTPGAAIGQPQLAQSEPPVQGSGRVTGDALSSAMTNPPARGVPPVLALALVAGAVALTVVGILALTRNAKTPTSPTNASASVSAPTASPSGAPSVTVATAEPTASAPASATASVSASAATSAGAAETPRYSP